MAGNTQFLLDTDNLLAALITPDALPPDVQTQLSDPANSILFSAASIWEIAIKRSLGREDFNFRPEDIQQLALETGFTELPILSNHCTGYPICPGTTVIHSIAYSFHRLRPFRPICSPPMNCSSSIRIWCVWWC
jgi:hypothetical protein